MHCNAVAVLGDMFYDAEAHILTFIGIVCTCVSVCMNTDSTQHAARGNRMSFTCAAANQTHTHTYGFSCVSIVLYKVFSQCRLTMCVLACVQHDHSVATIMRFSACIMCIISSLLVISVLNWWNLHHRRQRTFFRPTESAKLNKEKIAHGQFYFYN